MRALLNLRSDAERVSDPLPALMMQAQDIASSIIHGQHGQRKSGSGEKFWQFREYQDSDRPQDIDWRQSAKTDQVFTKQKEWQTTQKTYLWCSGGASMAFSSDKKLITKQNCAQLMTLALSILLSRGEEQIGVFGEPSTGRGENAINTIGHYLIERPYIDEALPNIQHFHIPRNAAVICAGDFLSPLADIEHVLSSLSERAETCFIVQILDPMELSLSYEGRIRFEGIGDDDTTLINHIGSVRSEYMSLMAEHLSSVQDLCTKHGMHYALHQTDHDISDTLRSLSSFIEQREGGL